MWRGAAQAPFPPPRAFSTAFNNSAGPIEPQPFRNDFFGSLKTELVHGQRYRTRDEAKRDLFANIEGYSNRLRLHYAPGDITPIQAELQVE